MKKLYSFKKGKFFEIMMSVSKIHEYIDNLPEIANLKAQ